jgi:hypothetical protein
MDSRPPALQAPRGNVHARPTIRRLLTLLLLLFVIPAATSEAHHLHARPDKDIAVQVNSSGGYSLFVVDGKSGDVFYNEVKANKDVESWDLQDFTKLEIKGNQVPRHPTALAIHGSSLYLLDSVEGAIFTIDLVTHASRLLLHKPEIEGPMSIAVSDAGILAIGQDDKSVLLYDPTTPDIPPKVLPGRFDEPVRLQFLPSASQKSYSLLVLDGDHGEHLTIYDPPVKPSDSYAPREIQVPSDILARLEQRSDTTLDIAFADGNFYLTEGHNWVAFSETGLTSARWVLFPNMYKVAPERLRSIDNNLFVFDSKQRHVLRLSLKLMTLRMEVNASEANVLLTDLYQALYDKGSLPERQYRVPIARGKLEELLRSEHVLAPGNYATTFPSGENGNAQTVTAESRLEYILCLLNRPVNGWQCPDSVSAAISTEKLARTFGQGQALVIPGLGVEGTRYEGMVSLRDRTVEDAVKDRLMISNPHDSITSEYLMRINPAYYRTLEYEMTRRGFILTHSPPVFPGAITWVHLGSLIGITESGHESTLGARRGCQVGWLEVTEQKPVPALSEKLRLYTPNLEDLPREYTGLTDQSILSEWNKRGIVTIEVIFDEPIEERGSRQALNSGGAPQCWSSLTGPSTYLVGDIISVSGMKYRFLRQDGSMVTLKQDDLTRWGLAGVVDDSGDWGVVVKSPFTLAYRAIPWDGQPLVNNQPSFQKKPALTVTGIRFVLDSHDIKPGSEQDIWSKSNGSFVLPGFRWELKLLTDSSILADDSVIRKWAAKYPDKVYVWPTSSDSTGETRPTTIINNRLESTQQEDLSQVTNNRDLLRKAISFPSTEDSSDITIGLMEQTASIELFNPDFAWQKIDEDCGPDGACWEFVWLAQSDDTSSPETRLRHTVPSQITRVVRTKEQVESQAEEYWKRNHGTHIAGLLVSNNKDVLGLLPNAQIRWLELGNSQVPLPEQITQASAGSLEVFNISQEFKDNSYDWLKNQIGTANSALVSKLFVMAAGNDGMDLNKDAAEIKAPVAWLHQFNNLLSVSAADMSGKLLFNSDGSYRVNYGVKFVDLLAPGNEIYSSTENDAYAAASGTSQAAPLVTATAALLFKKIGQSVDPSLLKGRLIYTADWEGRTLEDRQNWEDRFGYLERVWGGCLNANRTLFGWDHNIFLYEFGTGTRLRAIHEIPPHIKLNIKNTDTAEAYFVEQPQKPGDPIKVAVTGADKQIEFDQVLRLLRLKNNLYRIIYKDKTGRLRIIMNASIEGAIRYRTYEDITDNAIGNKITLSAPETIRLDRVVDYVGAFGKMAPKLSF